MAALVTAELLVSMLPDAFVPVELVTAELSPPPDSVL